MAIVTAIKSFGYPGDPKVRDEIRKFHAVKKNDGVGWDGDRGEIVEVAAGAVLEAPEDLLDSWLGAGLVLPIQAHDPESDHPDDYPAHVHAEEAIDG